MATAFGSRPPWSSLHGLGEDSTASLNIRVLRPKIEWFRLRCSLHHKSCIETKYLRVYRVVLYHLTPSLAGIKLFAFWMFSSSAYSFSSHGSGKMAGIEGTAPIAGTHFWLPWGRKRSKQATSTDLSEWQKWQSWKPFCPEDFLRYLRIVFFKKFRWTKRTIFLKQTNISPENGWLEYDSFPVWDSTLMKKGAMSDVSFREGKERPLSLP